VKSANRIQAAQVGSVLLVEVTHEPNICQGRTEIRGNDENGDSIGLSLGNYVADDEVPAKIFPVGMGLALLEPYDVVSASNASDGGFGKEEEFVLRLRCDNPQCLVRCNDDGYAWTEPSSFSHMENGSPVETTINNATPTQLRQGGNKAFAHGDMETAHAQYTLALRHPSTNEDVHRDDKLACLSNRAEVNLRMERYDEALLDAQSALEMTEDHSKARFRRARALSRVGRASEAQTAAKEMLLPRPQQQQQLGSAERVGIRKFLEECARLVAEERGAYDYRAMRKEAAEYYGALENDLGQNKKQRKRPLFHADFASPRVEIGVAIQRTLGITYRGCKAITDLEEGALVLAGKPFAFAKRGTGSATNKSDGRNNNDRLVQEVVRKLWKRPSLGDQFYSLSGAEHLGEELPDENMDRIDLPRIRAILSGNTFGVMDENVSVLLHWKKQRMPPSQFKMEVDAAFQNKGSGLWLRHSMLNHSCTPNCVWFQIGRHMFVTTARPVAKDEELCIMYAPVELCHDDKKKQFESWIEPNVGFTCACDHCHLFRTRTDLKTLADEIDVKYEEASRMSRRRGVSTTVAAETVFPSSLRKHILDQFSHLPPRLQHTSIAKLHAFEANVCKSRGDHRGALRSCQRARNVGYAVRGNATFEYMKDEWRVVGAAMACGGGATLAREGLRRVWNHGEFQSLPPLQSRAAFKDLTLQYALPWWTEKFDPVCSGQLSSLVDDVCGSKSGRDGAH